MAHIFYRFLVVASLTLVSAGAFAQQYREGQPTVIGGADATEQRLSTEQEARVKYMDAAEISQQFESAYADRGRPRLLVYMDRQLSSHRDNFAEVGRLEHRSNTVVDGLIKGEDNDASVTNTSRTSLYRRSAGYDVSIFTVRERQQFESGVLEALSLAGARVVDHAFALRRAGIDPNDLRDVEIRMLSDSADYLIELLPMWRPNTNIAPSVTVNITSIADGIQVSTRSSTLDADDGSQPAFTAAHGGFRKTEEPFISPFNYGVMSGLATLMDLRVVLQ